MSGESLPIAPWMVRNDSEARLLREAAECVAPHDVTTPDWARTLTEQRGVDFATAALSVHATKRSSQLVGETTEWMAKADSSIPHDVTLLIVPGALHRHHDDTGADGSRFLRIADQLGMPSKVLNVPSLDLAERNAIKLLEHLTAEQRHVVLVSLCKGSVDVKAALARPEATDAFRRVVGWLDCSGPLEGTPFLRLLKQRRLLYLAVRAQLALRGQSMSAFQELASDGGKAVSRPLKLPNQIRHIRALGFPLTSHLSHRWSRRGHAGMSHLGPNDGGGILLASAVEAGHELLPIWGSDHHLRPSWDIDAMFSALIRMLAHRAR